MDVGVVYESMFGNTEDVARAIAEALGDQARVTLGEVGTTDVRSVDGVDLLVVGGPTHMHGMSTTTSRKAAADNAEEPVVSSGEGLRTWLLHLPKTKKAPAAAFDTRLANSPWLTGSAAKKYARRLRRRGYRLVVRPESFLVADSEGPLVEGELERARGWATALMTGLTSRSATE